MTTKSNEPERHYLRFCLARRERARPESSDTCSWTYSTRPGSSSRPLPCTPTARSSFTRSPPFATASPPPKEVWG